MGLFRRKPKTSFADKRNGRKYRMGVLFALMILCFAGLCTMNIILVKLAAEVIGGIVGIYGIYCGLNVANKAVLGKWQGATVDTEPKPDGEPEDPTRGTF